MNIDLSKMTEEELFDLREEADGILTKIEADKDEMTIDDRTLDRLKKKMEKFINLTGSNAVFGKVKITISLPIYLDCEGEMFLKYHDESQLFDLRMIIKWNYTKCGMRLTLMVTGINFSAEKIIHTAYNEVPPHGG